MNDAVLDLVIIIPSYNPDEKLIKVVEGLKEKGFHDIIVVNDGSDKEHQEIFQKLDGECTIIHHKVNKGKGRAMKTAFAFCAENRKQAKGVITVDGDNQHKPEDVYACGKALLERGENLVLGCRNFGGADVPKKSKYGNCITREIFHLLCGLKISDTQTGLRAIPLNRLSELMQIKGERYEYETNMLLEAKDLELSITEVPIQTVYINDNESSHFHPVKDSLKIYGIIIRFFMNSIASTGIDLALFLLLNLLLGKAGVEQTIKIFAATAVARLFSSLFNYKVNREVVFGKGSTYSIVKYYTLCICQMLVSAGLVSLFSAMVTAGSFASTLIKACTDTCLFFISFRIQKNWVFRKIRIKENRNVFVFQMGLHAKKMK